MSWDVLNIIPSTGAPTVFEVVLQDRLVGSFRPAFNHFVDHGLLQLLPQLARFAEFKDEIWAAIHFLVEHSYLSANRECILPWVSACARDHMQCPAPAGATIAESLYGLWRAPVPIGSSAGRPLSRRELWLSLLQVVRGRGACLVVCHRVTRRRVVARLSSRTSDTSLTSTTTAHWSGVG